MTENKGGRGEAGILPLNYSRVPLFSATSLSGKDLAGFAASLYRPCNPSRTMGSDRKMDSKPEPKPGAPGPPSAAARCHFTTRSTYHNTTPTGTPMPFIALPLLKLSISRRTVLWRHEAAQVQSADRLVPKAASSLTP